MTTANGLLTKGEMMKIGKMMNKFVLLAAVLGVCAMEAHAKLLKVFILAGQSNMEGCADVRTFDYE